MLVNSPDITSLQVDVTWNLSGQTPAINLINLSTGSNLAGCTWAFTAYSPSLTPIHLGNIASPDTTGAWSTFTLNDAWATNPFNQYQVEWGVYQFYVTVKDSLGNIFSTQYQPQTTTITAPSGIGNSFQSYFGIASSNVFPKCNEGYVFFQDNTNAIYQGMTGTKLTGSLIVSFPMDKTGNRQANFNLVAYTSALVPVTINSNDYSFVQNSSYTYDFGNYTHVVINYFFQGMFGIWCGVDLLPLTAVINKFFYKIETNEFPDMSSALKRGMLILSEYSMIVTAILQPLAGAIDVPTHIMNIEQLTGFKCFDACCNAQSGIIPQAANSTIGGYNFIVNSLGGDVGGNFSTNGNNITLNIGDVKYIVDVTQTSPSGLTALTVTPQSSGQYTKYYHLFLDGGVLAAELPAIIQNNADTYNLWQALFNQQPGSFKIAVDGACIFTSTNACDYTFGLANIPVSTTNALLTGVVLGAVNTPLNYAFNQTNLTGLQTYLNGLGLGNFVVTNTGGNNISIASSANTNNITALNYSIANVVYTASLTKNCTGYQQKEVQEVIQDMIYAFCSLQDTGVKTSAQYTICYLDATGTQQTTVVNEGANLNVLIDALLTAGCSTITFLKNNPSNVNCATLQAAFPTNTNPVNSKTLLYGNKTTCAGMTPLELWQYMLTLNDTTSLALFCALVEQCGAGMSCEAISFNLITNVHNTACSAIVGIDYTIS